MGTNIAIGQQAPANLPEKAEETEFLT